MSKSFSQENENYSLLICEQAESTERSEHTRAGDKLNLSRQGRGAVRELLSVEILKLVRLHPQFLLGAGGQHLGRCQRGTGCIQMMSTSPTCSLASPNLCTAGEKSFHNLYFLGHLTSH